jgi:NADPH:quinone reductase-like Zn-dependent oxidoreductase
MKAAVYHRYGAPDVLSITEVEKPEPHDGEVLVKVHAASVTAADCAARKGSPLAARMAFGLFGPKHRILGTEFAGVVQAAGNSVSRFAAGDRVYGATGMNFGAHAEFICLPEDGALAAMPGKLSFAESAALSEGTMTALPFLRDVAQLKPGQSVLVNGASGSVGTSAVQLGKHLGAEVTGVCGTRNLELVKSLGADEVIDYTREDFTRAGRSWDVIFDAVGKSTFGRCRRVLALRGIYMTTVPSLAVFVQMIWTARRGGQRAVIEFAGLRPPADKARDLQYIAGLAEAGKLKPVLDRSYPLEQIAAAHGYVDGGHKTGHVVLTMPQSSEH